MADVHNREQRSRNMAAIKHKNTSPELRVRSLVHRMGFRYSLHKKNLPGRPDIVLGSRKKIIQVHGCFWHMHKCRYGKVSPATNAAFWATKRLSNVKRDKRNQKELKARGWDILIVWECATKDLNSLQQRLTQFLSDVA
ncbi:MAG TPA: DNA mismatch endonuclease Vsr [Candidatus Angelobacter sp.]|jgi:DNA mismatch endonuclease (patch repair protein)